MKNTLAIVCLVLAAACVNARWADKEPLCRFPNLFSVSLATSPAKVDLERYQGTWYEIVRKPFGQEGDCECAKAQYTLNSADYVEVVNTCTRPDGSTRSASAKAYSRNDSNTKLEVYFAPFIAGNYWILDIDVNYQWVIVGEPCKKQGWVLARTKTLPEDELNARIETLESKGYDVSDLIRRGDC